ncbi:MAG: hypothetical protein OES46_06840 [Gammaproteobacteria bacterium]|jgi:hypothetical protein|nr:hypothetical protein [Gammaproteobacteria bacterium]
MMRILFLVLAWPLIILAIIVSFDWVRDEFFITAEEKRLANKVQTPKYPSVGLQAVEQYSALPKSERVSVKNSLESTLISTKQWLQDLQESHHSVICLGENHEDSTREFLADRFFANIKVHTLLLEATPREMVRIDREIERGEAYVPLLEADIAKIIRAAKTLNPGLVLEGIEETKEQEKSRERKGEKTFRDDSILVNFWETFTPGELHVALFGALHCTNQPNWLFERLRLHAPLLVADRMLNIRVIGEHQDGLLEAFVFFIDEIGIERGDFVIPKTSRLHPLVLKWFALLLPATLERFQTLVIFRER